MKRPLSILLLDRDPATRAALIPHLSDMGLMVTALEEAPKAMDGFDFAISCHPVQLALPVLLAPKPIRLQSLLARVQDEAERFGRMIRVEGWLIDPDRRSAQKGRKIRKLTDKEAQLISALSQSQTPLSKDDLLAKVWGYQDGIDTHTLETHIYTLRRKLDDVRHAPQIILLDNGLYSLNTAKD